ncbi:MAG: helix-turn-helix domain-containing protein [Ruthenibacterium sp.]
MKIHEILREKRKERGLTQTQIADMLGVSTPAVNQWERGSSYPDITTLPALARLLDTDLNTLLSFEDDLTKEEIWKFANALPQMMQTQSYDAAFQFGMKKIEQYPTCDMLLYAVAIALDGGLVLYENENRAAYAEKIEKIYQRVSNGNPSDERNQADCMLIAKYSERKEYEKAQALLDRLPSQNIDKKQMQANLYLKQGKQAEAAELLETKLICAANDAQSALLCLMQNALHEKDMVAAEHFAKVSEQTTQLYDLWEYNRYVAYFLLATAQKDAERCVMLLRKMCEATQKKWDIQASPLYHHIKVKQSDDTFDGFMPHLLKSIETDDDMTFLRGNAQIAALVQQYAKS